MNDLLLEQVRRYFSGEMNDEEKLSFETGIRTNKELAAIVELYTTIESGTGIAENDTEEEALLRRSLTGLYNRYRQEEHSHTKVLPIETKGNNVKRISLWKNIVAAALVAGVLLTGTTLIFKQEDTQQVVSNTRVSDTSFTHQNQVAIDSTEQVTGPGVAEAEALYADNFSKDDIPSNIPQILQEALQHYKNSEYTDAIAALDMNSIRSTLEDLRPRGEDDGELELREKQIIFYAHYYKGVSLMLEGKVEKALPELRSAIRTAHDNTWKSKAEWYLALALLKTGRSADARILLDKIARSKYAGERKAKAIRLVDDLTE